MTLESPISADVAIFLGQFSLSKESAQALPAFVTRKSAQSSAERAERKSGPPSTKLLQQRGVLGTNVPFVLKKAGLTLCDANSQMRTGKDHDGQEREYVLVTFIFGRKANDDKKRQKELDTDSQALKEFQRLLNRRWADVNIYRLSAIESSPAVSMVLSGEGDPLEDPELMTDQDAVAWGLRITRTKRK